MYATSQLVLTHHAVKSLGKQPFQLAEGDAPTLAPVGDAGSGSVQEKQKALLREIIEKVNGLFDGELTDDDQLVYVNNVIKGKLLESEELVTQARNNSKSQFAASPTLDDQLMNAIMDALAAHQTMSKQALDSAKVRAGLKDTVLYAPRSFGDMTPVERIRACYQHAGLRYLAGQKMTNASLRDRFGLSATNAAGMSRIIRDTVEAGLIRLADPRAPKSGYVPIWA